MRQIQVTIEFRTQFTRLPRFIQRDADDAVQLLHSSPVDSTLGCKKLVNVPGNQYRFRLGEYRLIYSFTPKTLFLRTIGHRKNVYRGL